METELIYVYAVTAAEPVLTLDAHNQLFIVREGDLSAVCRLVSAAEYAQTALESRLRDMTWLEQAVCEHEHIIFTLHEKRPLVPLRFATIFHTVERVAAMLLEQKTLLQTSLTRLANHDEWGLKLLFSPQILQAQLALASPQVANLQAEIATKPAGTAYLLSKRLERLVANEQERLSDEIARTCHAELVFHASDSTLSKLHGPEITGPEHTMLLNSSYLIDRGNLAAYQATLTNLRERYQAFGFQFEPSGPWPGYSFVG